MPVSLHQFLCLIQSEPEEQRKLDNAVSKSNVQSEPEEQRKLDNASLLANQQAISPLELEEPPCKKKKRVQIPWRTPPEIRIREIWHVGDGANSKEVEVQKNRIRREREIVYRETQEIPSDPREPWDREMDYDDTLTPEIPIEQLPDVEPLEAPVSSSDTKEIVASVASASSDSMPEPDLELLAELLKNPDLVFALASGQIGDLSSAATVKLLDMIKANGVSSLGNLSGNATVEVSLPSPTPSSDPVPNGLKPDFSRNPFSRQHAFENDNAYQAPGAALPLQSHGMTPTSTLVQHQIPATTSLAPQPSAVVQQLAHMVGPLPTLTGLLLVLGASSPTIRAEPFGNVKPSPGSVLMAPSQSLAPSHPLNPQLSYIQEPLVSNSLSSRQGFDSNYHYQNNQTVNNYNAYAGGAGQAVLPPAGNWGGRNNLADRPEFESWSPDNSPSRRHEYLPGRYYHEASPNLRHGYRPERAMQKNLGQSSGYQDYNMSRTGSKRWADHRR
ncbi:UNVERIFIED_CONTAM: Homeobox protein LUMINIDEPENDENS [Sesamum radiatum]|uniref:Homeobox protein LUMINIDEPENDENS n=1 Tax=Sesamum radiatum TaxID=300843 RepID=A0AAW2UT04_SESRA